MLTASPDATRACYNGAMTSLADDTRWLDATDQAALVAQRRGVAERAARGGDRAHRAIDPQINAVVIRWFDEARERRPPARCRTGRSEVCRSCSRTCGPLRRGRR